MNRLRALLARLQATKPARAWTRLNDARGGILAGGIAYFGFFSLVPALTVGFTIFGYVIGGDTVLQRQVAQRVNASVGITLIGTVPGVGAVQLADLVRHGILTLTGVFGLVVLVVAGLGWLQAAREGIRAVFGLPVMTDPVVARLRDVASLGLLGLAVLGSLVAGVVVGAATGALTRALGWDGTPLAESAVWLGSTLVLIGVDTLIFLVFLTVLSGVRTPVADLRFGAFLAAAGMQVLKLSVGLLAHRLSRNPLLASSLILVGMLLWMNLAARLILFAAAWAAITAGDRGHLTLAARAGREQGTMGAGTDHPRGWSGEGEPTMPVQRSTPGRGGRRPRAVDPSRPSPYARRGTPPPPSFGPRSADRVTLAAGIVLGAGALVAARAIRRGLAAVRDAVRG